MSLLRLNFYPFLDNIEAVDVDLDGTRLASGNNFSNNFLNLIYFKMKNF